MTYKVIHNRPALVRGDTLLGWSITVSSDTYETASILSARSQLRTSRGVLVHEFEVSVEGNKVVIAEVDPSITSNWSPSMLEYDVEFTLADGRVVTWIEGNQPVLSDRTY